MSIDTKKDYEISLTRVEWMRARGYSEKQIQEYLKRKSKKALG
jgi:hypothetical protein